MEGKNEPDIRPGHRANWNATTFFTKVNSQLFNVEAIVMQCVGAVITDPEDMCNHCRRHNGPFTFCVTVGGIEECENCRWGKNGHRCSFNKNPSTPKSHRSSKLYMQEELTKLKKEAEDL
ncbi:hypothetical protein N7507_007500 [Penicillium longicatenatum]|nr:hypothetical protein N7507_007500 [Penicillium longicatenatum]